MNRSRLHGGRFRFFLIENTCACAQNAPRSVCNKFGRGCTLHVRYGIMQSQRMCFFRKGSGHGNGVVRSTDHPGVGIAAQARTDGLFRPAVRSRSVGRTGGRPGQRPGAGAGAGQGKGRGCVHPPSRIPRVFRGHAGFAWRTISSANRSAIRTPPGCFPCFQAGGIRCTRAYACICPAAACWSVSRRRMFYSAT